MSSLVKYPTAVATNEVTLAGPSFGDSKITPQEVKLHMTMGGTVVTTARPTDESTKILMTFPNITHDQWDDLIALFHAANGRDTLLTHPGGTFIGKMMNSPIQRSAWNSVRYSATIEMVGYVLDTTRLIRLMDDTGYLSAMTGEYIFRVEE